MIKFAFDIILLQYFKTDQQLSIIFVKFRSSLFIRLKKISLNNLC